MVAHATVDMGQLTLHARTPFVDTIASLQESDWGLVSVQEILESLTKIHCILDNSCLSRLEIQLVF